MSSFGRVAAFGASLPRNVHGHGAEHGVRAWQALSALASEQHHALKHICDKEYDSVQTSGEVQQQRESSVTDQTPAAAARISDDGSQALQHVGLSHNSSSDTCVLTDEVQAEIDRVQHRTRSLDPNKEVALRFDFLSGLESRASSRAARA